MDHGDTHSDTPAFRSLEDLVSHCTDEQGNIVDALAVAHGLKFSIRLMDTSDPVDLASVHSDIHGRNRTIFLSPTLSETRKRTIVAYALAEAIVMPECIVAPRTLKITVFTLRNFRQMRFARVMLLATRFAFSEQAIDALAELDNGEMMNLCTQWYDAEFVNATVRGKSIEFLISNEIIN